MFAADIEILMRALQLTNERDATLQKVVYLYRLWASADAIGSSWRMNIRVVLARAAASHAGAAEEPESTYWMFSLLREAVLPLAIRECAHYTGWTIQPEEALCYKTIYADSVVVRP